MPLRYGLGERRETSRTRATPVVRDGRAAPDLVVVDLASKPSAGLTAVKRVRARRPLAAIVAVTAPAAKRPASFERSVHVRALDAGADDVFALGSERAPVLVARLRTPGAARWHEC